GFVTLRRAGLTATVGRYEYRDGLETVPGDPTLAALKRMRIAERLVGPFEFTHVTRSFDGVRLASDRPAWNVTVLGTRPTQGGFEVSANRELDLTLAGAAVTLKRLPRFPPANVRLFYLYYRDRSSGDGNAMDGHHRTFFQLLPTARTYAQLPFYNLMNTGDAFVQVLLTPHRAVSLRCDYHWLALSDARDLWYSGGGATNDRIF